MGTEPRRGYECLNCGWRGADPFRSGIDSRACPECKRHTGIEVTVQPVEQGATAEGRAFTDEDLLEARDDEMMAYRQWAPELSWDRDRSEIAERAMQRVLARSSPKAPESRPGFDPATVRAVVEALGEWGYTAAADSVEQRFGASRDTTGEGIPDRRCNCSAGVVSADCHYHGG